VHRYRPHLTRTTVGLLLVLVGWVAVVAFVAWVLEFPATRTWLGRQLTERVGAAIGQPIRVADLHLSLLPPRVTLTGVEVGPPAAPVLRVALAGVTIGDVRLGDREVVVDHVRLVGVRVDLDTPPAPRQTSGAGWVRVSVRQLELEDVQIDKLAIPGGLVLSARDVEARWNGTRRYPISSAVAHVGSFTLALPGMGPVSGTLMAWGRKTEKGWELGRLRAHGAEWSVEASGSQAGPAARAEGTVEVELAALDRTLGIGAGLEGRMAARWQGTVQGREFRVDASVSSPGVRVATLEFGDLNGEAHIAPEGLEATVHRVTFAGGDFEGSYVLGNLGPPWSHRIAARGGGVSLAGFLRALGADDAGLSGTCSVNADVAWNGRAFSQGFGTGVADIQASSGDVPVAGRVVLTLEGDGALGFHARSAALAGAPLKWDGRLMLGTWIPTWRFQGEKIRVRAIARLLRGWVGTEVLPAELQGEVAADISLSGPFQDLEVEGTVAVAPVSFGPVDADGLESAFQVGHGVLSVRDGVIHVGSGRVRCRGELLYGKGGELQLALEGDGVPLVRMVAWGGVHAPLAGNVGFTGTLSGTIDSPQAEAGLRLSDVAVAGVVLGAGLGQVRLEGGVVGVSGLSVGPFSAAATVDLSRREAVVDASFSGFGLDSIAPPLARMAGGALDVTLHGAFPFDSPAGRLEVTSARGAHGYVELDAQGLRVELSRPDVWHLAGDLRRTRSEFEGKLEFGVESWHALGKDLAGTELPVEGRMAGEAKVRLAPPQPALLDCIVRELEVEVEGERAALDKPVNVVIEGGSIRLEGATLVGGRANLFVRAARANDGALSGNIAGELPGELLGLVWREARPKGRVELLGEIAGTDAAPRFEGIARVSDGSLRLPGMAEPVTRISGVVEFVPEVIQLDGINFSLLGGGGVCDGRVVLLPQFELDLALRAKSLSWPLTTGLRPILSGDLRLVGPLENLLLSGRLSLQRTYYRRPVDLQKLVVEAILARERAQADEESPMALNIAVDVPGTFEVESPLARLTARGSLRIVGTTARYGVLGRLESLPGAELEFSGTRYQLDRGVVTFNSPDSVEPRLDVLARATVQSYDITVSVVGTLDRMTPTFTSVPALAEMDIISLLVVGRRGNEATASQTGAAASSFLTGTLTGAVTNRARTLLDVDQLQVDPFASTQSGSPTARLTVAKQLTRDWLFVVSTNLTSNREEIVTSRWRVGLGVYLEAARQADGSYSVGIQWQRRY
jgi:translocation and assembly module TamB